MDNNYKVGNERLSSIFPMNGNYIMERNNIYKHHLSGKQNYKRFAKPKKHELLGYIPRHYNNKSNKKTKSNRYTLKKMLSTLRRKPRTSNSNNNTRHGNVRFASWHGSKKTHKSKKNNKKQIKNQSINVPHKYKTNFTYSINNNIESQLPTRSKSKRSRSTLKHKLKQD